MKTSSVSVALVVAVLAAGCTTLVGQQGQRAEPVEPDTHERLIWSHPYPNLEVTVHYVEELERRNLEPTRFALTTLEHTLQNVTAKPNVTIREPEPISVEDGSPDRAWTREEVYALRDRVIDHGKATGSPTNGTVYLDVLYLNGHEAREDRALGRNYNSFFTYYPDELLFPPTVVPQVVERAVLVHETGHSLGLVANPVPMQHERLADGQECKCHSRYEESVMHARINSAVSMREYLIDNGEYVPYEFDRYDKEDLRVVREAEPQRLPASAG